MKKDLSFILYLLLSLCIKGKAQDCYELNGTQKALTGPYKGESFGLSTQRFKTAKACADRAAGYKLSKAWSYSVNCKACEGYSNNPTSPNAAYTTMPPAVTPSKATTPNDGEKTIPPDKKTTNSDDSGLCPSQRGNIQRLKDAQKSLSKGDAAYSLLNSAINQMKNVDCGIVLNNVACQNNNCNFDWSHKDSNLKDEQAKASVDKFYDDLKQEEKQKAEDKERKLALVQLGVEAANAIADAIDENYQRKQDAKNTANQPKLKPVDDDGDGKTDALAEDTEDGGQRLYMDLDGDGIADKVANIDKNGKATYENITDENRFLMDESSSSKHNGAMLVAELDDNKPNEATDAQKPRYDNLSEINAIIKNRETIAELARSYASDPNVASKYSKEAELDNFKSGDYKCNKFIYDILKQSGLKPETPNGILGFSPTSANQWADPSFTVPGWRVLGKGEAILPGDVISMSSGSDYPGHVGIYVGDGKTASASSYANKLVINDWGLRSFDKSHRIVRRYDPN